jgi:hypothetical protein
VTGPDDVTERSPLSRRLLTVLATGAGAAAAFCLLLVLATLVRQRPVPELTVLLIPAIPLLVAGQLWTILSINARRGKWGRGTPRRPLADPRKFLFGDLRRDVATGLVVLAICGWLAAVTAYPALARGGPSGGDALCPYQLREHGLVTCVSKAEYERAGAAEQRLVAAALLFFFSVHTGAALGDVLRRRKGAGIL